MPLTTDEKVLALSEELLKQFDVMFGGAPRVSAGACQGCSADRHVYAVERGGWADAGASCDEALYAGDGEVFGFHGDTVDSGQ